MKAFDAGEYRTRVLARLRDDDNLADPQTGDPFLVCAIELDATTTEVDAGLDHIAAFWRRESGKPAYRAVVDDLLKKRLDAHRSILSLPVARATTAARVRILRDKA